MQLPSADYSKLPLASGLPIRSQATARTAAWLPPAENPNISGTYSRPEGGGALSTMVPSAPSVVAVQIKEARGRVRGLRAQLHSIVVPREQFVVSSTPLSAASSRNSTSQHTSHANESVINVGWQARVLEQS
jgi:hypothetical protein